MKTLLFLSVTGLLAGCATGGKPLVPDEALAADVHVLNCEGDWSGCIEEATEICGGADYTEVDRSEDWHITGSGRLNQQGTGGGNILQRNARKEVYHRSMLVRCD